MNIEEFTKYLNNLPISKHSRQNYLSDVKIFINWFQTMGIYPTNKLSRKYLEILKESGLKNSTIKRKTISLNHYAYFLKTSKALSTNFMQKDLALSKTLFPKVAFSVFAIATIFILAPELSSPKENNQKQPISYTIYNSTFPKNKEITVSLAPNNLVDKKFTQTPNLEAELLSSQSETNLPTKDVSLEYSFDKNLKITPFSQTFLTPTTSTQNQILYIKKQGAGYFVAALENITDYDIKFN